MFYLLQRYRKYVLEIVVLHVLLNVILYYCIRISLKQMRTNIVLYSGTIIDIERRLSALPVDIDDSRILYVEKMYFSTLL